MATYNCEGINAISQSIVILVQVDGLASSYIAETKESFFSSIKGKALWGKLVPTYGFEPDAAYIAGLFPDEADGGAQFWYNPGSSPFRLIPDFLKILNNLSVIPDKIFRRVLKKIAQRQSWLPTVDTANIPYDLLKYFSFAMESRMDQPGFIKGKTIFDHLRNAGKTWLFHGFPDNKLEINSVISRVENDLFPPCSFAFLHIGDLDRIGHKYGADSEEMKRALRSVDHGIQKIYELVESRFSEIHLVIIGDHGMARVNRLLDIWGRLKSLTVKLGEDYLVFLDSTQARFWFFNARAEKEVRGLLASLKDGHILAKDEIDKYHLNYKHNRFGDLFYLVDPGVLIFPNFYQWKKPVKGMHGYAPETPEQQSAFLIFSSRIKEGREFDYPVDMRRIFPTVLDLLHIESSIHTNVKSLLEP